MATPEKKKPASRVKKAAANDAKEEAEKDEPMEDSSGSDSQDKPNKPSDAPESRKRAKTVKEVVAAKKPKSINSTFLKQGCLIKCFILISYSRSSRSFTPQPRIGSRFSYWTGRCWSIGSWS